MVKEDPLLGYFVQEKFLQLLRCVGIPSLMINSRFAVLGVDVVGGLVSLVYSTLVSVVDP